MKPFKANVNIAKKIKTSKPFHKICKTNQSIQKHN